MLTVTRLVGNPNPNVKNAERIRSLASATALSGNPTIQKDAIPD